MLGRFTLYWWYWPSYRVFFVLSLMKMGLIPCWSFLEPLDITCFGENKMGLPTGTKMLKNRHSGERARCSRYGPNPAHLLTKSPLLLMTCSFNLLEGGRLTLYKLLLPSFWPSLPICSWPRCFNVLQGWRFASNELTPAHLLTESSYFLLTLSF